MKANSEFSAAQGLNTRLQGRSGGGYGRMTMYRGKMCSRPEPLLLRTFPWMGRPPPEPRLSPRDALAQFVFPPPLRLVVSLMALGGSSGLHPRNCLLQYKVHKAPSPCPALPGLVGGGHEEVDFNLIPSSVEPIHQLIVLMHGHALVGCPSPSPCAAIIIIPEWGQHQPHNLS